MKCDSLVERLFPELIAGDRDAARRIARQALDGGCTNEQLVAEVYWPAHQMLMKLLRSNQVSTLAHHYATRLLRALVDQAQAGFAQSAATNRTLMVFCGSSESDELAAQLVADMAEAGGFNVRFGGGGIANDELLAELNERKPDVLMFYSSATEDAQRIRELIDKVREIGACPNVRFAVGGAVLAQDTGADFFAAAPGEMLEALLAKPQDRAAAARSHAARPARRESRAAA